MLARIGVFVKLWFSVLSVLSNLKSHIIIYPVGTNADAPSNPSNSQQTGLNNSKYASNIKFSIVTH